MSHLAHTMATSADHLRPMPLPSTSRAPAPLPTGRAKSGTNGGTRFVIPRDSYSKFTPRKRGYTPTMNHRVACVQVSPAQAGIYRAFCDTINHATRVGPA